jgi:hypothetical protein
MAKVLDLSASAQDLMARAGVVVVEEVEDMLRPVEVDTGMVLKVADMEVLKADMEVLKVVDMEVLKVVDMEVLKVVDMEVDMAVLKVADMEVLKVDMEVLREEGMVAQDMEEDPNKEGTIHPANKASSNNFDYAYIDLFILK